MFKNIYELYMSIKPPYDLYSIFQPENNFSDRTIDKINEVENCEKLKKEILKRGGMIDHIKVKKFNDDNRTIVTSCDIKVKIFIYLLEKY